MGGILEELGCIALEAMKLLLPQIQRMAEDDRTARAELHEQRALARELGVSEPPSGNWEIERMVTAVGRHVADVLRADGVDSLDHERAADLVARSR